MTTIKYISISLIFLLIISCSKNVAEKKITVEKEMEFQMIEAYNEGLKELERGDALFAAKKFNEAEILFPQSDYAPRAALMAAYSYYSQDYYGDAIAELDRFIRVYPNHPRNDYAEYLLGLCFYEQIVDEKKDLQSITDAKITFQNLIKKYPKTDFAIDANYKLDLINDILAAKEIYIGRYYMEKKKWIPAINRFRSIIDQYDTTIYVEEALYRLVEIYYIIGLEDEAKRYANLLGYNYKSSKWYEKSYSIFNKIYAKNKEKNIKNQKGITNSLLKKFKSLFS
ncbi:outer membrane protein assembly factor BamD [Candidatus Pelagibacter sp.]|jgi:outer membrane protein assembly factor BamD|nr:outer membrane protein assembly factor BamD [Candidatus Pelagibacter sp.]|tara:strand:- start:19 stop:867 length:849 start_codon:yes stop_codon:yes gene_type:complete